MQKTNIEYLDYTWNPIAMRCTPCSPGCENCWHLRMANRMSANPTIPKYRRPVYAGESSFILRRRELSAPIRLKKPAVIGVQFMGDLFHESVPDYFFSYLMMHIGIGAMHHQFLMLSKRPERMAKTIDTYIKMASNQCGRKVILPQNIFWGLTVCNQQEADEKIPIFLQVPGEKFLSIEPMLGPIDLHGPMTDTTTLSPGDVVYPFYHGISAVILGGETGPGARPMRPDWVRSIRDQCAEAGVPFFFKQWGEFAPARQEIVEGCTNHTNGHYWYEFDPECNGNLRRIGRKKAGRLLDGRTHDDLAWVK